MTSPAIVLDAIGLAQSIMPALPAIYIICLIVGGGLLIISMTFGGDSHSGIDAAGSADIDLGADVSADVTADVTVDTQVQADVGHDLDLSHGGPAHSLSSASWFSLQFVVYFLAVFGLIGTTLTYASNVRPMVILLSALACGMVFGQFVHQTLRVLKRSGVSSDLKPGDYLNRVARVTIAIQPERRGEVAVGSRAGERFLIAVARRPDDRFKAGDRVVIVGFGNGIAEVVSRQEYEFVTDSKPGEDQ